MARHGENIRKRKDGRWEGRFLVYSKEKGKRIYRSVYAGTYDEVRKKLEVQKNSFRSDPEKAKIQNCPGSIRLSAVAEEWLGWVQTKRKKSTYIKYSIIYHTHIEPYFKELSVLEITNKLECAEMMKDLSVSICKSIYCVLNQILKFASDRYSVTVPDLVRSEFDIGKRSVKVFTQSEQKDLISLLFCDTDIFKTAILMCLFTGLRLGEICALKWSDIDLENKILTVNRTVQRLPVEGQKTKTLLVETLPKSEYSRREIPLPDTVLTLLMKFGNGKTYVFGANKPLEPRALQYRFKKMLKEAGIENKNFHILRHTFSTNCIEGGIDVKSLSEILGHSDVKITLNCYVHPSMDTKRQYIDGLSKYYGNICGQIYGQVN